MVAEKLFHNTVHYIKKNNKKRKCYSKYHFISSALYVFSYLLISVFVISQTSQSPQNYQRKTTAGCAIWHVPTFDYTTIPTYYLDKVSTDEHDTRRMQRVLVSEVDSAWGLLELPAATLTDAGHLMLRAIEKKTGLQL